MGSSITSAMKEEQAKNDLKAFEDLQLLHELMVNKLAIAAETLEKDALTSNDLPIVATVDKSEKYNVNVTNVPDKAIADSVNDMLCGDYNGGIVNLVKSALNEFLGNLIIGHNQRNEFHVVYANNSLLRVDYHFYHFESFSMGLKDEAQTGFCYYAQIGVLDLQKVNQSTLMYELTKAIGKENLSEVSKRLQQLKDFKRDLYRVMDKLSGAAEGGPEEEDLKKTRRPGDNYEWEQGDEKRELQMKGYETRYDLY